MKAVAFHYRQDTEATNRKSSEAEELDLAALELVQGGLAVPTGGSVREEQSQYSWFGMTYTQTHRTAHDAEGNVVGTELYRPGSVWSDTTERTSTGTRTTYDTGGTGLAAQLTTQHDNDGRFVGAGVDARANVSVGDFNVTGNLRGNVDVGRDEQGTLSRVGAGVHADAAIAHEPTGLGVRVGANANLTGQVTRDEGGNITGLDARGTVAVPLDLEHNGERLIGINLKGAELGARVQTNPDGSYEANVDGRVTSLGRSVGGEGHIRGDDTSTDFGASASYHRQLAGPYGAQFTSRAGFDASLGDNPELRLGADARATIFNREIAAGSVGVTVDGDGLRTDGNFRHVDVPNIGDIDLSKIPVPSLPEITVPPVGLPEQLPDIRWNPTGLPGNPANATNDAFQPEPSGVVGVPTEPVPTPSEPSPWEESVPTQAPAPEASTAPTPAEVQEQAPEPVPEAPQAQPEETQMADVYEPQPSEAVA